MNNPSRALSALIITLLICVGAGLTITLQHGTNARIIAAREEAQAQAFLSILPPDSFDNHPLQHPLTLPERTPATQTVIAAYLATLADQPSAILFHSQTQGYSGTIELLIGVSTTGKLIGVKVLKQNETPGLGARIATEQGWLASFLGKSMSEPAESGWALKKDNGQFDQIAGATITSRATVSAIHETLRFFDTYRAQLLSPSTGSQP
jgi:electron transport complex protein RnfG